MIFIFFLIFFISVPPVAWYCNLKMEKYQVMKLFLRKKTAKKIRTAGINRAEKERKMTN